MPFLSVKRFLIFEQSRQIAQHLSQLTHETNNSQDVTASRRQIKFSIDPQPEHTAKVNGATPIAS